MKSIRIKVNTEPWMTGEILEMINTRDNLYCQFKKDKNNVALCKMFCSARNKVQRSIKKSKSNFVCTNIEENKNNA